MTGKKLMALMIAPMFALGMAACDTESAEDDVWTEEGQVPAQQDPYTLDRDTLQDPYDVQADTLMVPEAHPERPEEGVTEDPQTEPRY